MIKVHAELFMSMTAMILLVFGILTVLDEPVLAGDPPKKSSPGEYAGYSPVLYDSPIKAPWEGMVTIITQPLQAEKGLTYTTAPLDKDTTLTGHPVVHLWISSTAPDGDFWVDLEDIDPDGDAETIIPLSGSPNTTISMGKPLP